MKKITIAALAGCAVLSMLLATTKQRSRSQSTGDALSRIHVACVGSFPSQDCKSALDWWAQEHGCDVKSLSPEKKVWTGSLNCVGLTKQFAVDAMGRVGILSEWRNKP